MSLFYSPPAPQLIPLHCLDTQQPIERTHERHAHFFITLAVPATFFCGRQGKKQFSVVSAQMACNRKRFLTWFQFFPFGDGRVSKGKSRYTPLKINRQCTGSYPCWQRAVLGVSERLVSEGGAFYSLLAQEGRGLVFWRVFLSGWDLLPAFVVLRFNFFSKAPQNVREQMKGWHKNHDGKTSMCDMREWPFSPVTGIASFPACPALKAACSMKTKLFCQTKK